MLMEMLRRIIAVTGMCACVPFVAVSAGANATVGDVRTSESDAVEAKMREYGLVDISELDATICVELKYATADNFVGKNMYGGLRKAFFRPEIARAIVAVQRELKRIDSRYSLVIYDAARPQSAQRTMYDMVRGTLKQRYVAKPARGGHHNFGIAVDLSILYDGKPVDMGSGFDTFTEVSHIDNEVWLLRKGLITRAAYDNRRLLRRLMRAQGFTTYKREWWHFQKYDINYARRRFKLLSF